MASKADYETIVSYKMQRPVVSMIIPTYGRPKQLEACLAALMTQTFSERWEVVVVDDGSPNPVTLNPQILNASECGGPLVRIIRQNNAGPALARNHGVAASYADLVAFTDDDCRPEPSWLEMMVTNWRLRNQALIGGSTLNGLPNNVFSKTSQYILDLVYMHYNFEPNNAYFLASNNILCSKQQFLNIGGFDSNYRRAGAEDRDFCDRWRVTGWPLIWLHNARIEHHHHQNLVKFVNIHYRYGRGAYIYQNKRKQRHSGSIRDDLNFHRSLLGLVTASQQKYTKNSQELAGLIVLLIFWQLANASGFAWEALLDLLNPLDRLLHRFGRLIP